MKVSNRDVAAKMRAFTPEDLLEMYKRGRRNFEASNLLRAEIEATIQEERSLDCLDHPDRNRYNPLWLDYKSSFGESDFEWDRHGHCLDICDDLPDARDLRRADLSSLYAGSINPTETILEPSLSSCLLLDQRASLQPW